MIHFRTQRRGSSIMIALVVLTAISISTLLCVRQVLTQHRQQRREAEARQAQWLAVSAVARAAAAMERDAAYAGEIWTPEISQPAGTAAMGRSVIKVEPPLESARTRRISVDILFPDDPLRGTRHVLSVDLPLPAEAQP